MEATVKKRKTQMNTKLINREKLLKTYGVKKYEHMRYPSSPRDSRHNSPRREASRDADMFDTFATRPPMLPTDLKSGGYKPS